MLGCGPSFRYGCLVEQMESLRVKSIDPAPHFILGQNSGDNSTELVGDCSHHPFLSVIVCTRGLRDSLEQCLISLFAQECKRSEVLLVLNDEENEEFVRRVERYPVRLFNDARPGVCVARNRAIAAARGDLLCFVDDDVVVDSRWMHELIHGFEDPDVACVTGRVVLSGTVLSRETIERSYGSKNAFSSWTLDSSNPNWYQIVLGPDMGFGCNMAFRKSFLETHALFPEGLGAGAVIAASDETFMFFQVLKNGFRIHHSSTAVVTHLCENDPIVQKNRMKIVSSACVALRLKLLVEEPLFREGLNEPLSFFEKSYADLRGLWVYWKYRRLRNRS